MKRVIALLLALMLLPIFTVVTQAAGTVPTMSQTEFKEVLKGQQTTPTSNDYQADLIRAYRNVSTDQLNALRTYHDSVTSAVVSGITSSNPAAISNDEAQILAYGFIKLLTFPNQKNGTVASPNTPDNNISDADIDRAAGAFYTPVTCGTTTDTPANVLNQLTKDAPTDANGYMTKNALGAFLLDLQKNLRAQAAANPTAFLGAFVTPGAAAYVTAIETPYLEQAAADSFTNTTSSQLIAAKNAMIGNGMLTTTGTTVNVNSPFIQLLVDTIDALKADNANVAAVVMNTIMSGVMDAKVEVYSDAAATLPVGTIVEPNNLVASIYPGESVYLKVVSDAASAIAGEATLSFTPSLSRSLDAAVVDTTDTVVSNATVVRDTASNMLKLTGVTPGSAILKLYRDTNTVFDYNGPNNDKELFMELNVTVLSTGGGGGGGSTQPRRVSAPTMKFRIGEDGWITVTLETETPGATIYYTTDGTEPNENSQRYTGPFKVPNGTKVRAVAYKDGLLTSFINEDIITNGTDIPTLVSEHIAYVQGRDTGMFDAEDNVTRAEVSAIFSRLIMKKMEFEDDSVSKFADVADDAWYAAYVKTLSNSGIIQGYSDGTFKPDNAITRAEFATIASRFFQIEEGENNFSDVMNHWAKQYIDSAATKGWILGYEDGTFKPDQPIKRSEAVTIVNRMLGRVADQDYIAANVDKVITYPDLDKSYWAYYEILEASNWHDHKIEDNQEYWTDIFNGNK